MHPDRVQKELEAIQKEKRKIWNPAYRDKNKFKESLAEDRPDIVEAYAELPRRRKFRR